MSYEKICANIKVQNKKFLTQEEVAVLCHLSKKTIYKLERSGKLPYAVCLDRLTHTHQIKTEDVLAMLKERHCKQEQDSLYLRTMRRYYKDRLRKEKDVLEMNDIMRLTGFSKSGVLNWLSLGKLQAFRMGKSYMTPKRCLLDFWLSPTHRTIKNKSAVQKADIAAIEQAYRTALPGGDGDE
ncbi:MAG: helix-turn-helix domain-containing protein [Hydrogenoanaerobacterium sp.]